MINSTINDIPVKEPQHPVILGQYSENMYYLNGSSFVSDREQDIIEQLLLLNHGVGIAAGYYDESYSICMISELAVRAMNYADIDAFMAASSGSLLNITASEKKRRFLMEKLSKTRHTTWILPVRGQNGELVSLHINNTTLEEPDGRSRWFLSLRQNPEENIANEGMRAGMKDDNPEHGCYNLLAYIGKRLQADRAYIFERHANGFSENTYEWCAPGVSVQIDKLRHVEPEAFAQWYEFLEKEQVMILPDIEDLKDSAPKMYALLKPRDIHSLILVPLIDNGTIIGIWGVDDPEISMIPHDYEILDSLSNFTVLLLKKRTLFRELRDQSRMDFLTGAGNRFAMYDYIDQIWDQADFGMLFCDLTGLKAVNDNQGHAAGDLLLKDTYRCIQKVFDSRQIFRIGGDEFIVLTVGFGEEELKGKIPVVEEELRQSGINMAIGWHWTAKLSGNFDAFSKTAERRMYEAKSAWYRQSGIDRRK